jgi:hypothetical protein
MEEVMLWSPSDQLVDNSIGPGATDSSTGAIEALYSYSNALTTWNDSGDPLFEEVATPELMSFAEMSEAVEQQHSAPSRTRQMDPDDVRQDLEPLIGTNCPDALQVRTKAVHSKYEDELHQLASLSRLSERTSKAASNLISLTGDPPTSPEPCIMLMERPETNPMAEALVCSEEFVMSIKCLISPSQFSDESSSSKATECQTVHLPNRRESPSISTVLLVLSIYSQLRRLFDLLFSHIHRSLNEFSNEVLRLTRIRLKVHVGALPPMHEMQANLYTWMVVHIMQGNAQNMDYHMELLARYCHSFSDTPSDESFANNDLNPILQRIMKQVNGDIHTTGGNYSDSLQGNIQKVLERLGSI